VDGGGAAAPAWIRALDKARKGRPGPRRGAGRGAPRPRPATPPSPISKQQPCARAHGGGREMGSGKSQQRPACSSSSSSSARQANAPGCAAVAGWWPSGLADLSCGPAPLPGGWLTDGQRGAVRRQRLVNHQRPSRCLCPRLNWWWIRPSHSHACVVVAAMGRKEGFWGGDFTAGSVRVFLAAVARHLARPPLAFWDLAPCTGCGITKQATLGLGRDGSVWVS
jgi:hypothetical protein